MTQIFITCIIVMPAKAGIHANLRASGMTWIPAFAGMTGGMTA